MGTESAAVAPRQAELSALSRASGALWLATLALMTAYTNTAAPAHRYLLASRIARNLSTLHEQECFSDTTRAKFALLAVRWRRTAESHSSNPPKRLGMLARWLQ